MQGGEVTVDKRESIDICNPLGPGFILIGNLRLHFFFLITICDGFLLRFLPLQILYLSVGSFAS